MPPTWTLPTGSGDRWVDDYERARPGWPREVIDIPGLASTATVLDLAAGTGKLTRLLAPAFDRVIAVEPEDAMRCMHAARYSGVDLLAGTVEEIPLADASVDAAFVAEAFHLFGNERSVGEMARVLRPGGALVILWNVPAGPWEPSIAAVEQLLNDRLPKAQDFNYDPLDLNSRRRWSGEWRQAFAGSSFGAIEEARLPNPQRLDRDGLVAFFASMGWIADMPNAERLPLLEEVRSLLDDTDYRRTWETHVHWTRLVSHHDRDP
jgi:SAM-dependent methyltransferase